MDKTQSLSTWGAATTGAGAVWAAGLKPYGLVILGASGLLLAFGFRTVNRRPVAAGEACSTKRPVLLRWILWFSALLWMVALAVNVFQGLASRIG